MSLLDRLLENDWPDVSQQFHLARFLRGIRCAATKGQADALKWWCTKYLPAGQPQETRLWILRAAAFHGHMHILDGGFLSNDESMQLINTLEAPLVCQHPEIIHWIRNQDPKASLLLLLDHAIGQGDLQFVDWA